ncbi:solute carrier family 35 member D1a isoform X2 [Triplophysa dalaica]|uniref:solute carrier family 35 member D1a isoform X2 n=1 Tax=Triplophysa dalaica TaxID=1582913 RepID=UPI0024DFB747|nr:solute carrier family 35 member D1a isoform X2 [Triplophysa dalaica]
MLRICPSEPYNRTKNSPPEKNSNKDFVLEHVPLCFDDELERQNVKVLTARPPTVHTLPIVSETYPVIYNTYQYQHKPFKSPGLHFLETPKPLLQNCCVLNNKSHSAVIRNTDSMQDPRSKRIGERSIGIPCPQNSPYIGNKTMRARSVHVLLADGNVTKCPNNSPIFVHHHDITSPGVFSNDTRRPPVPFFIPRQRSTQVHVGPVVNGINPIPNHSKRSQSDNINMTTGKLTRCRHVTPPQSQKSVAKQNGTDFLVISKALQSQQKSDQRHDFDTKQHLHEEFGSSEIEKTSHNYEMSQVTDDKHSGLNDESLSRPNSSPKHTLDQAPELSTLDVLHSVDDSNTCSETMGSVNDSETLKSNHDIQWSHAINIPTAESCE